MRWRRVGLVEMLKMIHEEYLPLAREKDIDFEFAAPKAECITNGDAARLSQVFTNLVTNAIKFTPRGGQIKISIKQQTAKYAVSIRDSGQGMDTSFLPFVFDRLKQEDMSTTRAHGGLGLGLAITSHIVEQHKRFDPGVQRRPRKRLRVCRDAAFI